MLIYFPYCSLKIWRYDKDLVDNYLVKAHCKANLKTVNKIVFFAEANLKFVSINEKYPRTKHIIWSIICCMIISYMCFRCRRWAVPTGALSGPSASWIVCCSHILCGCSCRSTKTPPSISCSESLLGCVQANYFNHMTFSI